MYNRDIIIDQGTDATANINLKYANGVGMNVSLFTYAAAMAKSFTGEPVEIEVLDANVANGNIYLSLDANTTMNLVIGKYVYDVIQTDDAGLKTKVQYGLITVNPTVTE